jgi:hypothetical protein
MDPLTPNSAPGGAGRRSKTDARLKHSEQNAIVTKSAEIFAIQTIVAVPRLEHICYLHLDLGH